MAGEPRGGEPGAGPDAAGGLRAAGVILRAAALTTLALAGWNLVTVCIADASYRRSLHRVLELLLLSLPWYALLAALPVILAGAVASGLAASGAWKQGAASRRSGRGLGSLCAGAGAGAATLLVLLGSLGPTRNDQERIWTAPLTLAVIAAMVAATAAGLAVAHLSASARLSQRRARRIRLLAATLGALPCSLLAWELLRDRLGDGASHGADLLTAVAAVALGLSLAWGVRGALGLADLAWERMARAVARRPARSAAAIGLAATILGLGGAAYLLREATPAGSLDGSPARPNVIVLVADTLRADRVGCYGAVEARTPAIDALARRGTRIDGASAVGSWTAPNTASLLTGLYPDRHGLLTYQDRIRRGLTGFAEIFRSAGFQTAGFSANPILSPRIGFGAGFETWEENVLEAGLIGHRLSPLSRSLRLLGLLEPPWHFPRAGEMVQRALRWIDGHRGRPFLLYLQFMDTHDPYAPPPPFDTIDGGDAPGGFRMELGTLADIMAGRIPAGRRELEAMKSLYQGSLAYLDDRIGHLMSELSRRGLLERTLIVLTADHGEEFLDHGGLEHTRTLYQEIVGIPMIFAGPGVREGATLPGPVSLVSIAPTLLEAARVGRLESPDGRSLWPALTGAAPHDPGLAFMSLRSHGYRARWRRVIGVRRGEMKLTGRTRSTTGSGGWSWELFDLAANPAETESLESLRTEEMAALRAALEKWRGRPEARERIPDEEEAEHQRMLRTLGYVD